MLLSILLSLNPRCPEVTIYINRNGWGFSEEVTYHIAKQVRRRRGPKRLPYNSSIKLAKKLYDGIIEDTIRHNLTEKPDLQKKYVSPRKTAARDTVHLDVDENNSEKVMSFINEFVKKNKLQTNVGNTQISAKGHCERFAAVAFNFG